MSPDIGESLVENPVERQLHVPGQPDKAASIQSGPASLVFLEADKLLLYQVSKAGLIQAGRIKVVHNVSAFADSFLQRDISTFQSDIGGQLHDSTFSGR